MKTKRLFNIIISIITLSIVFYSCEDDSRIGSSLSKSDVSVVVDSSYKISGKSIDVHSINSKSMTQLLGRLSIPEYGSLSCSFVTQLMSAVSMDIPDSITIDKVDSLRLRLTIKKGSLTGDSLAPQQLKIYRLNKQLPNDITNNFNPSGYYDESGLIGVKSYTASALGMNDTLYNKKETITVNITLPKEMAINVFNEYRNNPETFQWHDNFVKYFPGLFVEQTFGRGCVINISSTEVLLYYHDIRKQTSVENGEAVTKDKIVVDSATLFTVSPEIISSNNIRYEVSNSLKNEVASGEAVITSPTGYNVEVYFPTEDILTNFLNSDYNLAVINNLTFTIPVKSIENDYGINPPPYLLMVKSSEKEKFFNSSLIPDDKTSFYAIYDSEKCEYSFTSMREYIVELRRNGGVVTEEDCTFTLIPVMIETETSGVYNTTTVVSSCVPYVLRPTMCVLDLDNSKIKFTYSKQVIM